MRGKLLQDNGIPHPILLKAIDAVDRQMLFPGYQEYYRSLVYRDQIVLSHNDAQENNILASLADNRVITLIDFEYGGWNPIQYDLANYLNEFELDNAHPKGTGIAYYPENAASDADRQSLVKQYLKRLFDHSVKDQEWD